MEMDASAETIIYEIRVGGHIDNRRARQLGDMALTHLPGGETLLVGPVADQAALFGLLSRIRDLGIVLISLQRRDPDPGSASIT
jgi:hypothetical protein